MKALYRLGRGLMLAVLLLVVAMALGTLVSGPAPEFEVSDNAKDTRRVLVLGNGIHTDIVLPSDSDVLDAFAFVTRAGLDLTLDPVEWIVIGRGGRRFYTETPDWSDLRPGAAFASLTWDSAVLHVQRAGTIDMANPSVIVLDLNPAAFDRLTKSILASFANLESGGVMLDGAAYGPDDIFLEANGGFNALIGCNIWTAKMLRGAGRRIGFWTPLSATVFWSMRFHGV